MLIFSRMVIDATKWLVLMVTLLIAFASAVCAGISLRVAA